MLPHTVEAFDLVATSWDRNISDASPSFRQNYVINIFWHELNYTSIILIKHGLDPPHSGRNCFLLRNLKFTKRRNIFNVWTTTEFFGVRTLE